MIEIRYLQAESGANKFGTCNCCGKSSGEDPLMISIKFSYYGHGTLICLCDDCRKKLIEVLNGEQLPPANNSEIPNSSDTISRQAAIEALHTWFRNGFDEDRWWNSTHVLAAIEGLQPAQPERIKGRWIESDAQNMLMKNLIAKGETWRICDKCGAGFMIGYQHESDKIYHETFHNFCPKCGADMREVTT